MLALTDFNGVLVSYLKEPDKKIAVLNPKPFGPEAIVQVIKGKKRGVVVAIAPGIIGWSLCSKKDSFDREKGIGIALGRALTALAMDDNDREDFYMEVPDSLVDIFNDMIERAEKYFQAD